MSKKIVWIPLLLITAVLISGCISNQGKGTNTSVSSDLIPTTNLPSGFTYMGTHITPVYIGNSSINATEGVYRNNGADFYIQVIENDTPQALLAQYKLQIQNEFKSGYNPFTSISFNGHDATQVADIHIEKGQQRPNYAVVWTTGKAMILVASPTADNQTVIALATATGS
jgi:hypothetical protein